MAHESPSQNGDHSSSGVRWIFFDLFDTLCTVDEEAYFDGKRQASDAIGIPFNDFMQAWRDTARDASIGAIPNPFLRSKTVLSILGIPDRALASVVARLDIETVQNCVFYYPDVEDSLQILRERGFSLGLISNATATTAFVVSRLRLREKLDRLVFSYEVGLMKPDERIYRLALERAPAAPETSLFVGDGASRELDGARSAGMRTLLMDQPEKAESFRDPDELSSGDHPSVESFQELLDLDWL